MVTITTRLTILRSSVGSVIGYLGIVVTTFLLPSTTVHAQARWESVLQLRIDSLKVDNTDMENALRLLRETNPSRILMGFEEIPHFGKGQERKISLKLEDQSLGEVLAHLCKLDPRYGFELDQAGVINVFPLGAKSDATDLLNIRISKFSVRGRLAPGNVITRIRDWAPELGSYLAERARQSSTRTGIYPPDIGAQMTGNMDPQIQIDLENLTVREILNTIASHHLLSWKYEFVIDPDAPNGLGGYPRWDVF